MPAGTVSITFTDGSGAVTLTNNKAYPASRFASWEPFVDEIGAVAHRLGSGVRDSFIFRTDYGAKFELRNIPASKHADCIRLLRWLQDGGSCAVNTGDASGNSYATCGIRPESKPALTYAPDGPIPQWTLALELINLADTPAAMVCVYGSYD